MATIKLSSRLDAIARLVPPFGGVADVGTDHGYIPVWLFQSGHKGRLCATDINIGPLEHAKQAALGYGINEKIEFFLCNGLDALDGTEISTIVIAGMGGETITDILSSAPWTREKGCLLILQPMTKSPYLRKWLFENGYKVLSEQLVEDGTVYEILTACAGTDVPYSPAELLIGHKQLVFSDTLYSDRLSFLIEKANRTKSCLTTSIKMEASLRLNEINEISASLLELQKYNIT